MNPFSYHTQFAPCEHSTPLVSYVGDHWIHLQPHQKGWQQHTTRNLMDWIPESCRVDDPMQGRWSGSTFTHQGITFMLCSTLHNNTHFSTLTLWQANPTLTHWQGSNKVVFYHPHHPFIQLAEPHIHTRNGRTYCLMTALLPNGKTAFVTFRMHTPHHWEFLSATLNLLAEPHQPLQFSPSLLHINDWDVLTYHSPGTGTNYALIGQFSEGHFNIQTAQVLNEGMGVHRPRLIDMDHYAILNAQFNSPYHGPLTLPTQLQITPAGEVHLKPFKLAKHLTKNPSKLYQQVTYQSEVLHLKPAYLLKLNLPSASGTLLVELLSPTPTGGGIHLLFDTVGHTITVHHPTRSCSVTGTLVGQDIHIYVDGPTIEVFNAGRALSLCIPEHPPGTYLVLKHLSGPCLSTYSLFEHNP
ncbi:hypothetical protein [Deinococcus misasensis]|uniref:hypothetical protein n=1 Tax=Deinococcus misasensis TaxID=392413 RepID=UPI0005573AD4|nr:hypothetical protein [Deinococcus misasensis]